MKIPTSILLDVDTAHDVLSRDTTPNWYLAAADVLEAAAIRIRAEVQEQMPAENAKEESSIGPAS